MSVPDDSLGPYAELSMFKYSDLATELFSLGCSPSHLGRNSHGGSHHQSGFSSLCVHLAPSCLLDHVGVSDGLSEHLSRPVVYIGLQPSLGTDSSSPLSGPQSHPKAAHAYPVHELPMT